MLFTSDRAGQTGLWAVPITDGKPVGVPTFLQADIASSWSMGATSGGALFVWKDRGGLSVQTAPIDLTAGRVLPSGGAEQFIRSRGAPEWSPDGQSIAYKSCNGLGGGPCALLIWSLETGKARELPTRVKYFQSVRWAPDGRSLIALGSDFRGKAGLYRIDTQTGDVSAVMLSGGRDNPRFPDWATDGRSIYYRQSDPSGMLVIIQRDLTAGTEREALRTPADNRPFLLSPDRRSVAYSGREGASQTVMVAALERGDIRTVQRAAAPDAFYPMSWTSDGRALLVAKFRDDIPTELWLTPADGGAARKIDADISKWTRDGGIRLSPDDRFVTFVRAAGKPGHEIWALENYLTALNPNTPITRK